MNKELNHVYRLYALIVHEGYNCDRGHYYSYIKNQETNIWYRYDDENVKPVGANLNLARKSC